MHWNLWGVSHLGLAKLGNCNQILGHVADQDCIEFIDSARVYIKSVVSDDNKSAGALFTLLFYCSIFFFKMKRFMSN